MTDEWDQDRIDLRKLGLPIQPSASRRFLNLTRIEQTWLRQIVRQYLRQRTNLSVGSLCDQISSWVRFSKFLQSFPEVQAAAQIDRPLIQTFISFLMADRSEKTNAPLSVGRKIQILQHLRQLFETQPDFLPHLILTEQIPRPVRTTTVKWIPESVVDQLLAHQHALAEPFRSMLLVILEIGCRVGELCELSIDCLSQELGNYYLTRFARKQRKTLKVPISPEIASVIQAAQLRAKAEYGDDVMYLFPKNAVKPFSLGTFNRKINDYINKQQITDESGQLWHFTSKQCRHTVATRLINSGVSQPTIQRFLGHETPTMTDVYAQIHDQTLKKAFFEYQNRIKNGEK
jgi:integrase/recombinase XerD